MNVLEKIIEEIRDNAEFGNMHWETVRIEKVIEIIRSHMNDVTDTNVGSKSGWIPYTEQNTPSKDGIYLVTCDDIEYPVKRMRFKGGLWYWTYGIYDGKILAWTPLPAPYKGGKEDE